MCLKLESSGKEIDIQAALFLSLSSAPPLLKQLQLNPPLLNMLLKALCWINTMTWNSSTCIAIVLVAVDWTYMYVELYMYMYTKV